MGWIVGRQWWCTPLIPALGRQRKEDLCEFEASLVYRLSSKTARTVKKRNPVSIKQTKLTWIVYIVSLKQE